MEKKNKILIIGARGMLGQELVNIFEKDANYEVFSWDKDDIDITQEEELGDKLTALNPQIIINAAAYNAVDRCEEDSVELEIAKKINGLAPGHLAKIAARLGATLVHYSTDYVFNGQPEILEPTGCSGSCGSCRLHEGFQNKIGFDENSQPEPLSKYGETKLLGEREIKKNAEKFYIIRLSKLFGKPAKSNTGKRSFFDVMLEAGRKNKEVKVVDEETSCFTYAPDLAAKTKEILENQEPWGIYHVTNSDPCTWYEAVLELYQRTNSETQIIPVGSGEFPRPAKRPYYSVLLNTKLAPMRSWKNALQEYLSLNYEE